VSDSVFQTLYISKATEPLSPQSLTKLATYSWKSNASLGVTGALLAVDKYFIQVLEGDELIVRRLLKSIIDDSRHTNLKVILEISQQNRDFALWSMGHIDLKGLSSNNIDIITNTCHEEIDRSLHYSDEKESLCQILEIFKANKFLIY
jgi:hypothetical protein